MGGLSKVHMPSSARAGTLAASNPQDRRGAKEREDAKLLMLFRLPFCRLCKTIKSGGCILFQTCCPAQIDPRLLARRICKSWPVPSLLCVCSGTQHASAASVLVLSSFLPSIVL